MYDQNAAAQGFAAHPRVVHQKPKFKDPYGQNIVEEYYPQNIMFDKRVQRGSTYAAMVLPAGNYPDTLFDDRKARAKAKAQARAAACEEFFTRDQRTPEPIQGRQNIDIQTDQFVEELTDKAPCYEIGCQTEIKIDRPQTPRFMPKKKGVDKKTLVEDNELFVFEDDVEPILSVLCGKTLEQSRMEVLEEEELREMQAQQEHFNRMNEAEKQEMDRMEAAEKKKLNDFEKLKSNKRELKKNQQLAHRKIVARQVAKGYLGNLRENTYQKLKDVGYYTDNFKIEVLDNDVVPWLYERAFEFVQDLAVQDSMPSVLLADLAEKEKNTHIQTVKAEAERKEQVSMEHERVLAEKAEERRIKKEEKERKKKEAERLRLRGEIEQKFNINDGADKKSPIDSIEILNMDCLGDKNKPFVGALGGVLGQMIIVLSIMEAKYNRQMTNASRRTGRSGRSQSRRSDNSKDKAKSRSEKSADSASKKTEEAKSEAPVEDPADIDYSVEPTITEKGWFDKSHIQNFILTYLAEKQRMGPLQLVVSNEFNDFLSNLAQPIPLNKSRKNFRDAAWNELRRILRTPELLGDKVIGNLSLFAEKIGVSRNVFNMVNESFWDLYFKRPTAAAGIKSEQVKEWYSFTNLSLPRTQPAAEGEEPVEPEVKAIVRVRIPMIEPPKKEDGEEPPEDNKSQKSGRSHRSRRSKQSAAKSEPSKQEIEWEDRVLPVASQQDGTDYQVFVLHQLAQRMLRQHIAKEFRTFLDKELDAVTEEEMFATIEAEAEKIEDSYLKLVHADLPIFDFELN